MALPTPVRRCPPDSMTTPPDLAEDCPAMTKMVLSDALMTMASIPASVTEVMSLPPCRKLPVMVTMDPFPPATGDTLSILPVWLKAKIILVLNTVAPLDAMICMGRGWRRSWPMLVFSWV